MFVGSDDYEIKSGSMRLRMRATLWSNNGARNFTISSIIGNT